LGAAPERPFAPEVYHPFKWRDWQDFGSGALGDFGCHVFDPVFGALELTAPVSIVAENAGTNREVWPGPETVTYVFPGTKRTAGDQITIIWRDGGLKPARELAQLPEGVQLPSGGSLFIGEGGTMVLPHVGMPQLYAGGKAVPLPENDVQALSHWHVWVDAVIAGTKTSDGFHYAGPLTETVQLGNVAALLPGTKLRWDAEKMTFTDGPQQASALLTKSYRPGFEIQPVA
jgi:predicted dehydrogenase